MDYIVFLSLHNTQLHQLLFSYDITCQWWKKLWTDHHNKLPSELQLNVENIHMDCVILKFHLHAHTKDCHTEYSLNLTPGVGHTNGEVVERNWSAVNPAVNSMKEMSEGSHYNTLDDIWGDLNYQKMIAMGNQLCSSSPLCMIMIFAAQGLPKKLSAAIKEGKMHTAEFNTFCDGLESSTLSAWQAMVSEWEADCTKLNPCPQGVT
jgi:Kyakuja-Dileera-Zisupton transposase